MNGDNPLPDGVTANATDDGDVSLMVPTSDAHAERRGIILSVDEAVDVARDIFAAVDEANDDPEEDGVVYITAGGLPNGIYLMADTPPTAHPLAVEGGEGDRALLREALSEHGVDVVEPIRDPDERVVDEADGGSD